VPEAELDASCEALARDLEARGVAVELFVPPAHSAPRMAAAEDAGPSALLEGYAQAAGMSPAALDGARRMLQVRRAEGPGIPGNKESGARAAACARRQFVSCVLRVPPSEQCSTSALRSKTAGILGCVLACVPTL
jgi:hypothetical protein